MIIVYGEKTSHEYEHFKIKAKDPENMLRRIRTFKRILTDWQMEHVEKQVKEPWFDFIHLNYQSRAAALFHVWIKEKYEASKVFYDKMKKEDEEEKERDDRATATIITKKYVKDAKKDKYPYGEPVEIKERDPLKRMSVKEG